MDDSVFLPPNCSIWGSWFLPFVATLARFFLPTQTNDFISLLSGIDGPNISGDIFTHSAKYNRIEFEDWRVFP